METFEQRLKRFRDGPPQEIIGTLLNSINTNYIRELKILMSNGGEIGYLPIIGVHSIIMTISKDVFSKTGKRGFKYYLKNFVDWDKDGFRFSEISDVLYDWRNVIVHQFISRLGHSIGFDYVMDTGYRYSNETIFINPRILCRQLISGFEGDRRTQNIIWHYSEILGKGGMEKAKVRILKKYIEK